MREYRKVIQTCSAVSVICFIGSIIFYGSREFLYDYLVGIACSSLLVIIPMLLQYIEEYKRRLNEFEKLISDLLVKAFYIIEREEEGYNSKSIYEATRDICFDILSFEKNFDWVTRKHGKKAMERLDKLNSSLLRFLGYQSIDQALGYISSFPVMKKIITIAKDISV